MKVKIISLSDRAQSRRDYRNSVEIEIDGKSVFEAYDGEPEDNCLSRNFSDVFKIPKLMQMAYDVGKRGEEFELSQEKTDGEW